MARARMTRRRRRPWRGRTACGRCLLDLDRAVRADSQEVCNSVQLAQDDGESEHDQSARERGCPGDDQRIA